MSALSRKLLESCCQDQGQHRTVAHQVKRDVGTGRSEYKREIETRQAEQLIVPVQEFISKYRFAVRCANTIKPLMTSLLA